MTINQHIKEGYVPGFKVDKVVDTVGAEEMVLL